MKNTYLIILISAIVIFGAYMVWQASENDETAENNEEPIMEQKEELKIETLQEGTGTEAQNGDELTVHYVGRLESGAKFDSSIDRGTPFIFNLGAGQVIKGWDLGTLGMKVGEKRKLTIPGELGYGAAGAASGLIPPNATLIFEIELLAIN